MVGIDEDGLDGVSAAGRALIANAGLVVGGTRHLALADGAIRGERRSWPSPLTDIFSELADWRGRPVAVLASGDPLHFGIATTLLRRFPAGEMMIVPAISAISLACARLGWVVEDISVLSLCGRPLERMASLLRPGRRIIALSADATTPRLVADYLAERGFGPSRMTLLEALGGPREGRRDGTAGSWAFSDVNPLNLLAIEVAAGDGAAVIPRTAGLPDTMFENDGQLSKQEIRAVTLAKLAPRGNELLWDVGCGSGSVAIEWLLSDPTNRAVGIEVRADRAARAARNAAALGVPHLDIVTGQAPAALDDLPLPDAVFIGGGIQPAVLTRCWDCLRPGGRIVVNGVTIETEARLVDALDQYGGTLCRISIARLGTIGNMRGLRPAMAVTQWSATKP